MRMPLLILMLLLPSAAIAYHFGPGQSQLALDQAADQMRRATKEIERQRYDLAVAAYDAALEKIPADRPELTRGIQLERAKARLENRELPQAYDELTALKAEVDGSATPVAAEFVADVRKTMADAQYYMTWLLRLEGEPREAWEPDIEAARQNYKLLAEDSRAAGAEAEATRFEGDLEAAIRLARLDLSELQALPLPKQCQGCCSGKCQCKCKGKKPGRGERKTEDARGAGMGPPPDETGS